MVNPKTKDKIKFQSFFNLMDSITPLRVNYRVAQMVKRIMENMVIDITKKAERAARHRKKDAGKIIERDLLFALQDTDYNKFLDKEELDADYRREVPEGGHSIEDEHTG